MTLKAVVTGGAGFVGSHLVDVLLDREWEVLVVDDLTTGSMGHLAESRGRKGLHVHVTDITSPELHEVVARHGPEVVFHLAAQPKVPVSVDDPVRDARINIIGTLNVLEAAVAAGARKVAFASSGGAIYGGGVSLPAKESADKTPESPYGISKKVVEDYFRWFREAHGLEYTLLAPANIYGPRQSPGLEGGVVAIFTQAMLAGERPVIFGNGTQTRDFVYVDDVCDAFLRAADDGDGLLLNIGSGVETSINELFDTLASITGFSRKPQKEKARPGDVFRSVVDPGAAKKALDWEAWTPLRKGLERTVEWHKARA
jgi:UDP-glucose 4-epimerase